MENAKKASAVVARQQLNLIFETEVSCHLTPKQRQEVVLALVGLLLESSGLEKGNDDEH